MKRTVLTYVFGPVILAVLIFSLRRILNPNYTSTRTITTDVVQGILAGIGLAFITLLIIGNAYVTKVNGWTTMSGCGEPGIGILRRAACNVTFLGPINVPQEAMYWTTSKDGPRATSPSLARSMCRKRRCIGRRAKMVPDTR
ncbi:MAG: hypothetical protein P8X64_12765 [Anaerolineales bacterium]